MKKILCSRYEGSEAIGCKLTKLDELVAMGHIKSIKIGSRRLLYIESIQSFLGIGSDQHGEA